MEIKRKNNLTDEYIRSILDYNSNTGEFIWKYRNDASPQWNGQYAGKKAGSLEKSGYITIRINKVSFYAHRLAWLYVHGKWSENFVDHANGIKKDNKISNLRDAMRINNARNMKKHKICASGYKGVRIFNDKFQARISINYKRIHLGTFNTAEKAYKAYCISAKKYFGEFSRVA